MCVWLQVYLKSERAADALAAAEQSMDIMQVLRVPAATAGLSRQTTGFACSQAQHFAWQKAHANVALVQ